MARHHFLGGHGGTGRLLFGYYREKYRKKIQKEVEEERNLEQ